jgi:hypothetical protein
VPLSCGSGHGVAKAAAMGAMVGQKSRWAAEARLVTRPARVGPKNDCSAAAAGCDIWPPREDATLGDANVCGVGMTRAMAKGQGRELCCFVRHFVPRTAPRFGGPFEPLLAHTSADVDRACAPG